MTVKRWRARAMALAIGTCALVVVSPHDVPTAEAAAKRPSRRDIFAAKKLAGQALDLMKAGSFEAAIEKFEAAWAAFEAART